MRFDIAAAFLDCKTPKSFILCSSGDVEVMATSKSWNSRFFRLLKRASLCFRTELKCRVSELAQGLSSRLLIKAVWPSFVGQRPSFYMISSSINVSFQHQHDLSSSSCIIKRECWLQFTLFLLSRSTQPSYIMSIHSSTLLLFSLPLSQLICSQFSTKFSSQNSGLCYSI